VVVVVGGKVVALGPGHRAFTQKLGCGFSPRSLTGSLEVLLQTGSPSALRTCSTPLNATPSQCDAGWGLAAWAGAARRCRRSFGCRCKVHRCLSPPVCAHPYIACPDTSHHRSAELPVPPSTARPARRRLAGAAKERQCDPRRAAAAGPRVRRPTPRAQPPPAVVRRTSSTVTRTRRPLRSQHRP
jgi:hypothetical protein